MRRLGEIPYFDEAVQREGIDELFSTGWLETALWLPRAQRASTAGQ
jgi:hypothetical protein